VLDLERIRGELESSDRSRVILKEKIRERLARSI
jgi:hypothetical protein